MIWVYVKFLCDLGWTPFDFECDWNSSYFTFSMLKNWTSCWSWDSASSFGQTNKAVSVMTQHERKKKPTKEQSFILWRMCYSIFCHHPLTMSQLLQPFEGETFSRKHCKLFQSVVCVTSGKNMVRLIDNFSRERRAAITGCVSHFQITQTQKWIHIAIHQK